MLLIPRHDLIQQFKKEVNDFNMGRERKIELISLKDYDENQSSFDFSIKVYYYRSDLVRSEKKETILDYKTYENNGNWYVFLDEAHRGDKDDSLFQKYVTILSKNGFLFNFSATFTDPIDYVTTCYNFNLEKFITAGYGKNIYVSNSYFNFTKQKDELSIRDKQKQVLKSLIIFSLIKKQKKNNKYYHHPLLMTLVNSVNTKDSDLLLFFNQLERIASLNVDNDFFEDIKKEISEELVKYQNYFFGNEKFPNITIYDDRTVSITYYKAKPDVIEKLAGVRPIPEHFYTELDEQFVEDFQFKFEPTTGPYEVKPENVKKGESVTLTRVPGWWADKKPFYRNRFNPDAIKVTVVREPAKVFELFLKGELDWHGLGLPEYWYEKLPNDHSSVKNGHIEKVQFYNDVPRPTWALRLNSSDPVLSNRDIRVGLNYAMNFELVIEKVFRGDYERMRSVADGYAARSHPAIKARPFSVEKAKEYFAKAGYSKMGSDGVLETSDGKRLSFTFTTPYKRLEDVMTVLKEEAKKVGVELQVEIMERTAAWKKISEKKHQIMLGALNTSVELYPRFWEPYHSDNAYKEPKEERYEESGKLKKGLSPKPVTNNFSMTASREIDELIDTYRESEDLAQITELSHTLIEKIHDHAGYIPGWVRPWYRVGQWRWVKYPKDYNVRESRVPFEYHIHWIDTDEKTKTMKNLEEGKASGSAAIRMFDKYKID